MRQIFQLKIVIEKRKDFEFRRLASLHGHKMKESTPSLNLSPAKREEYNKEAYSLLERLKKRQKERQKDGIK